MRALLSDEQLLGLLAYCCDCTTDPKQLVRSDHGSFIVHPPTTTANWWIFTSIRTVHDAKPLLLVG